MDVPTITRRPAGCRVPLSQLQANAWFLQRLEPSSVAYHEVRLWRIDGAIDAAALAVALSAVAVRQPILRTRYVATAAGPIQVIDANPSTPVEKVDFRGDDDRVPELLDRAIRERTARRFDLAAAAPWRWTLFKLADDREVLLLVWHHIMGDGWSGHVLSRELSQAYAEALAGRVRQLPPLAVDFADYAVWQEARLAGHDFDPALLYWKKRLADVGVLRLPTDFARPPVFTFQGATSSEPLSASALAALGSFGRKRSATTFMVLLAAFATLLSRLTGQEDFAIGTPVAGRYVPELEPIIGYFANFVVVRADMSGEPDTATVLSRTRECVLDALEWQAAPFNCVVDALGVPRDPSRNPLFQVAFAMREELHDDLQLQGADVRRLDSAVGHAKFDLTLTVIVSKEGARVRADYCTGLFLPQTVERTLRQYASLIEGMAREAERPVATLPLMGGATEERLRTSARLAAPDAASDGTIHGRFAARASMQATARAIESMTYGELDAAANCLARELAALGAGRGAFVAVARERASDIAVAWLAVLKVGAAYLPIDPDLPSERIAFMQGNARVAHAIADVAVASRGAPKGGRG
jgi:hypothetical protein